jgi:hypothetical protein
VQHFPLETSTCEANIIGACLFENLKASNILKSLKKQTSTTLGWGGAPPKHIE